MDKLPDKIDKGELLAVANNQDWNLYDHQMYNHLDWFWASLDALQKGDLFLLGGNFIFPDWQAGRLYKSIQGAIARGANVIVFITRFYVGGYNSQGKCYQYGCPKEADPSKAWKCEYTADGCQGPSCQQPPQILYDWACAASNYLGAIPGVTSVDIPNFGMDKPYSHWKHITFYYKSRNMCSIYHGSLNLDVNPNGHNQNEVGWGFMANLDEPFAQYHVHRDAQECIVYRNYYTEGLLNADKAIALIDAFKTEKDPPPLPIKINTFRFCGPKFCFADGESNTYDCDNKDWFYYNGQWYPKKPAYCQGAREKWVCGVDHDVEILPGVAPVDTSTLPDWDTKGFPRDYYPDHVMVLAKMISESTYFKSILLSQGFEEGTGSKPPEFAEAVQKFLNKNQKWFQIQATPGTNEIGFSSFAKSLENTDDNLFMRHFVINPKAENTDSVTERTHEKLFLNQNSVMYSSGHPQNDHLQGPIINEFMMFNNSPNFRSYAETWFNYVWFLGTVPYQGYPQDPAKDFAYCGDPKAQVSGGFCCTGKKSHTVDYYTNQALMDYNPCEDDKDCDDGYECKDGQCAKKKPPKPECSHDSDCKDGYHCVEGKCMEKPPKPECSHDSDCGSGKLCINGECRDKPPKPECSADSDCGDGYVCVKGVCAARDSAAKGKRTLRVIGYLVLLAILIVAIIYVMRNPHVLQTRDGKIAMGIMAGIALIVGVALFLSRDKPKPEPTPSPGPGPGPGPGPEPTPKTKFYNTKGLSGQGWCYGPKNSYPYRKVVNEIDSADACKDLCAKDDGCLGVSYNATNKYCVLYSKDEMSGEGALDKSKDWRKSLPFPTYASPYVCPDPLEKIDNCRVNFPDSCTKWTDDISCWKKYTPKKEHYEDYSVKVGPEDNSFCQVVVSNPFIPPYLLSKIKHTFYWWFLELIQKANKFLLFCNAYFTLGKYQSDDPTDYQSAIHLALAKALERGVKVQIITVTGDQAQCVASVLNQTLFKPYLATKQLEHRTMNLFFHDKVYASENSAYLGGQNTSGSFSIDFGISFASNSPLYPDVVARGQSLFEQNTIPLNFQHTADNPFKADDGVDYFIALSPISPMCAALPLANAYPQGPCSSLSGDIPPVGPNPLTLVNRGGQWVYESQGKVSYERNHLLNLIDNAKKFLTITSFDWSFFGDVVQTTGYDTGLRDSILNAVKRGVDVNMWIQNAPISDNAFFGGNATCNMLRCKEGQAYLAELNSHDNFHMHWWYQKPLSDGFPPCRTLHAKIHYSDWGLLISSSNLTATYFGNTPDIGFCAVFNGEAPEWISKGVGNMITILEDHSKAGKYTCDHKEPNFQVSSTLCYKGGCKKTCQQCDVCASCENCPGCQQWQQGSCGANCMK